MDISWDDAILALGTESGSVELYNFPRLISNSGKQLQALVQAAAEVAQNSTASATEESKEANKHSVESCESIATQQCLQKVYHTKTQGILVAKFSWMNFLFTVGCVNSD